MDIPDRLRGLDRRELETKQGLHLGRKALGRNFYLTYATVLGQGRGSSNLVNLLGEMWSGKETT